MAITDWLVAYYPMNGNANDFSGNWWNGIVSWPVLTNDRFWIANKAYSFNWVSDYITLKEAWINPIVPSTNWCSVNVRVYKFSTSSRRIITKIYWSTQWNRSWSIHSTWTKWTFTIVSSDWVTYDIVSPDVLETNKWIMLTWTYDITTGILNLYVNWVLKATGTNPDKNTAAWTTRTFMWTELDTWTPVYYDWYIWIAWIRDRPLLQSEIETILMYQSWNHRIEKDWTYNTNAINTLWVDPTWLSALYQNNNTDISWNWLTATLVWTTPTTNYLWEANWSLHFDWIDDLATMPSTNLWTDVPWYTVFYMIKPTTKATRTRPIASTNLMTGYYWNSGNWWKDYNRFVWNWISFSWWATSVNFFTFDSRHFVAITYDKSTWKLYKDWQFIQQHSFSSVTINQVQPFTRGWASGNFVDWDMYYVWMLPRVMSDSEIETLSKVLYWDLRRTKWTTYINSIDTNTPPTAPIRMKHTKWKLAFTSLNTI